MRKTKSASVPVAHNSLPSTTFLEDYIVAKIRGLAHSTKEKCDYMLSNLQSLSTHNIRAVADTTVAQSTNEKWQRARVGRITASNLGRIKTKTSLSQQDDVDAIALLKTLMNYNPVNSNLSALVYGHNMAFWQFCFIHLSHLNWSLGTICGVGHCSV